jgi:prevent-host-death family protein
MKTVSVSELKANLSKFLREVRRGGEIQVLDRGVPVARLTNPGPASSGREDDRRRRLVSAGILRAGSGKVAAVLDASPLELPVSLSGALDEHRSDRL